jgi:hypothetical protein
MSYRANAGTSTHEPNQGKPADRAFNPKLRTDSPHPSCSAAAEAVRDFAQNFEGGWSYPFGWNCRSFQIEMMKQIGFEETSINRGLSSGGSK